MKLYQMHGSNGLATCTALQEAGWVMIDIIIDEGITRGWKFQKRNDEAVIWLEGLEPHVTMDDLTVMFTGEELFKIFPDNWFAEEYVSELDFDNWHQGKTY